MRYNKTLGVAIAAVLSGGIGLAQADTSYGELTVALPASSPLTLASELVEEDGTIMGGSLPSGSDFQVKLAFSYPANIEDNVNVFFELDGATFTNGLGSNNLVDSNFTLGGNGNTPGISLLDQSEGSVSFVIQSNDSSPIDVAGPVSSVNDFVAKDYMMLDFTIDKAAKLASNGKVKIKVSWGLAPELGLPFVAKRTYEEDLVKSSAGVVTDINNNSDDIQIDVTQGNAIFINDGIQSRVASLGTLNIDKSTTSAPKQQDLSTGFVLDDTVLKSGSLYIESGPFAASAAEDLFIQIDVDGTETVCEFEEGEDIIADEIDGIDATWNFNETEIVLLADGNDKNICVTVPKDNTTPINEGRERPTAAVTINYDSDKKQTVSGRLSLFKRNGAACTLYNVPNNGQGDIGFYRFVNRTSETATVWGTLRGMNGDTYFLNAVLQGNNAGVVPANGTLIVRSTELHELAVTGEGLEGGSIISDPSADKIWPGRAVLSINSDSTDMQVYGFLRAKNLAGVVLGGTTPPTMGPLINISAGASGNGCN